MRKSMRAGKRLGVAVVLAVLLSFVQGCAVSKNAGAGGSIAARPDALGKEELKFTIPEVERWELANGLTVFYYFDDELPQVRGKMYFPGGTLSDPWKIAGLLEATGDQLREGSVPGIAPDELDKRLDAMAAAIESDFDDEFATVSFFTLAEDFDEVFTLFEKVVRTPAFATSRLDLWKKLAAEGIRRRRDDPGTMGAMTFQRLLYGEDSPFGRAISLESLGKITPQKMRECYRRYVRPDGAFLTVAGAIPKEKMKQAIEAHFGSWAKGAEPLPPKPSIDHVIKPGVYVLERDFDQATVYIGHRGPARHTPDQYAIAIYNRLFGHGSFGSLLFREIRSRLGLAYSVFGGIVPGPIEGSFQINMGTRATEAMTAVEKSIELAKRLRTELPPETEFNDSKSAVERSFVFKFADPGYLVDRAALLKILGYPDGYDANYLKNMEKVTREDVRAAAEKWIHPEELVVVVVGKLSPDTVKKAVGEGTDVYPVSFSTEPSIGEKLK